VGTVCLSALRNVSKITSHFQRLNVGKYAGEFLGRVGKDYVMLTLSGTREVRLFPDRRALHEASIHSAAQARLNKRCNYVSSCSTGAVQCLVKVGAVQRVYQAAKRLTSITSYVIGFLSKRERPQGN
jgi:hypothetical protein